jgi:putative protease
MKKATLELLAPAGNKLKMETALFYGADAVYLGIPDFSLRVRINDFNLGQVKEAIKYAHDLKKKVYITVNIFAHNRHLELLPPYLKELNKLKPDAFIVSDPGIILLLKKYCPKIPLHLSTQANCTNSAAVKFWQSQGIKRIILGREVTLKEIGEIHKACPKIELEYFVHGAMCMAYSGRCFLSKEYLDRSANLGDCVQPCRWEYETFIKAKGHDEVFELVTEDHGSYLLNSKDLCLLKYLKQLTAAGITSFKIEGRAKSVYYIANLVGIYKAALNNPAKISQLYKELETKLVHRGYTTGFLLGEKGAQNINDTHNKIDWEFCGQVVKSAWLKKGIYQIWVKVHNSLKIGDEVEIILPYYDVLKTKINKIIDDATNLEMTEAHGGGGGQVVILEITSRQAISELTVLRRKIMPK